jgi:hypothetical protein
MDELKEQFGTLLKEKGTKDKLATSELALEKLCSQKKKDPKEKKLVRE